MCILSACRRGATATGSHQLLSPQTSVTSPTQYTGPSSQVEQSQSFLNGLIDDPDSFSDSMPSGHVITAGPQAGYHPTYRYPGLLTGYPVPEPEMVGSNLNENEINIADADRGLDMRNSQEFRSTFPDHFQPAYRDQSTMEDILQPSPVSPPPPPPLLDSVLTPVPSTNLRLAGRGAKTTPLKVFGVRCTRDLRR